MRPALNPGKEMQRPRWSLPSSESLGTTSLCQQRCNGPQEFKILLCTRTRLSFASWSQVLGLIPLLNLLNVEDKAKTDSHTGANCEDDDAVGKSAHTDATFRNTCEKPAAHYISNNIRDEEHILLRMRGPGAMILSSFTININKIII